MYDLAHPVNVVKTYEALSRQLPNQRQRHSFIVVSFDDFQEVHAQNFENHDEMLAIWSMMDERVQQLRAVRAL
jgi:hypothetical protein